MVQINANREFCFRSRMTDIRARGDVSILHQYAFIRSAGVITRVRLEICGARGLPGVFGHPLGASCCLRAPIQSLLENAASAWVCWACRFHRALTLPGGLVNKWGRGWREEGVQNVWPAFQSMCKPAENGNVERVTEVDAQWATHPIPVCWARQMRRPLWRQFRFNTIP